MASYRKPAIAKGNRDSIQLTTDNSNFALTLTKIDFPWISVIHLLQFYPS